MRVIAGRFRGRVLEAPAGKQTRPMTDRVKESLFNILGSRFGTPGGLPACEVLDLFAGAGALGIEAVSRGAASAILVERDRRTLPVLRANIAQLTEPDALRIIADNVWAMRLPLAQNPAGFGVVFLDPPYRDANSAPRLLDLLERVGPRLAPEGVAVLRVEIETKPPLDALRTLRLENEREFGRMRLMFLAPTPIGGPDTAAPT